MPKNWRKTNITIKKNISIVLLIIVVPIKIYSFDYYKNLLDNLFSYYSIGYRDNQNINKQGSIVYTGKEAADHHCTIRKVKLSGDMIKSAKSNYTVSKFLKDDTLVLEHATYTHSSSATRQASLDAFTSGRMDVFYGLNVNQYVDMQLTQEECQEILSWLLGKDVHDNGQSPEEKMYEQKKSLNRISSVLTLSIISGALGLLTTVMNGLYYDYIQVLLPVLVIAEGILLYKATQHGGTDTGNRLLLVSMILSALLAVYFGYVSIRVISVLLRGNIPIYGLSHICSLIASVIVFISAFKSKKKTTC